MPTPVRQSEHVDSHVGGHDSSTGLAVALLFVEAALLVLTTQAWGFSIFVTAATLGVLAARRSGRFFSISSRWILGLAVICVLKLLVVPYEIPAELQFIRSQFAHEFARFLIGVQLLLFACRDFVPRRAATFEQLGWGVLIFSCDVRVPDYRVHLVQITLGLAIVLHALFAMSTRRAVPAPRATSWIRLSIVSLTLLMAVAAGSAMASGIARHERQLEWLLTNYLFPDRERISMAGFSGRGSLESVTMWQQVESDKVVLQAVCEKTPGYVIGRVFDTFQSRGMRSEWSTTEASREMQECYRLPAAIEPVDFLAPVFGTPSSDSLQWEKFELWSQSRNRLFVPLQTELVAVHAERVAYADGSYSAFDRQETGDLHYVAYGPTPTPARPLDDVEVAAYLSHYSGLDPRAAGLAEQIFAGCTTTAEKCRAVEDYLTSNYEYSRQVIRPRGVDQISDFLLHNRQGHCEYFATAAALLLRLAGVPTRYVTGYVLIEQNPFDGSWIARNSHAHAWTLAFDAELQRWRVVEATPSEGTPEASDPSWWTSRRQAWSLAWKRWMSQTREVGLLPSLGTYVGEHWLIPLIVLLSAVGLTVLLRRWSQAGETKQSAISTTPPKLVKVLRWIDRAAGRLGIKRGDSETLQSFALRVHNQGHGAVAAAYREYARIRYSRAVGDEELAQLRVKVRELLST